MSGFVEGARPICAFCNAPWTDDMIAVMSKADHEMGYYGDCVQQIDVYSTIDITCESCDRLIYRKEIRQNNVDRHW